MMENDFVSWLVEELDDRGWSQRELARRAGISAASVNQILGEQREPSPDFCISLASAFRLPAEFILRKAGHLPPGPKEETDPRIRATVEQLLTIWNRIKHLDPDSLDALLNIVVTQAEMVEAAANAARRNDSKKEKAKTKA